MYNLQLDKINNQSVVNNVVSQISSMIIKKRYVSGDRIPTETELSKQLGVCRNSIREAIKIMGATGLLEVQRSKGTFVRTDLSPAFFDPLIFSLVLEPKSNKEVYEFRMMFDTMVLFCVIDKVIDEQIFHLKEIIEQTFSHYKPNISEQDIEFFIDQDILFHKYLLEITNNPLMQRIGYSILQFIPEYIRKSIKQENGILRSIINHREIISILETKEKSKIFDIIEVTLEEWKNNWSDET